MQLCKLEAKCVLNGALRLVSTLRLAPSLVSTLRPSGSACQHAPAWRLSLVSNASASPRFRLVVSIRIGGSDYPPVLSIETSERKGAGRSGIWLKATEGSVLTSGGRQAVARYLCTFAYTSRATLPGNPGTPSSSSSEAFRKASGVPKWVRICFLRAGPTPGRSSSTEAVMARPRSSR